MEGPGLCEKFKGLPSHQLNPFTKHACHRLTSDLGMNQCIGASGLNGFYGRGHFAIPCGQRHMFGPYANGDGLAFLTINMGWSYYGLSISKYQAPV